MPPDDSSEWRACNFDWKTCANTLATCGTRAPTPTDAFDDLRRELSGVVRGCGLPKDRALSYYIHTRNAFPNPFLVTVTYLKTRKPPMSDITSPPQLPHLRGSARREYDRVYAEAKRLLQAYHDACANEERTAAAAVGSPAGQAASLMLAHHEAAVAKASTWGNVEALPAVLRPGAAYTESRASLCLEFSERREDGWALRCGAVDGPPTGTTAAAHATHQALMGARLYQITPPVNRVLNMAEWEHWLRDAVEFGL